MVLIPFSSFPPPELFGRRVRVHRNLHRKAWSITVAGRVVAQCKAFALVDCSPVVLASGIRRSLARGTRTVHAYVEGVLVAKVPAFAHHGLVYVLPRATGGGFFAFEGDAQLRWMGSRSVHGMADGSAWASIDGGPK